MAELEEGIRAFGVIEPIIVRPIAGSDLFEIIAGERRWRAAKNVFGDAYDMPVVIRDANDADSEAIALIENYHRAGMSVAEEARTAQRQLLRNRGDKLETARNLGWSLDVLESRLALMACTPAVLKALTQRQIMQGHAELLAGVPPEKQDTVLSAIVAHKVPVTVLKAQLGQYVRRLADAIFDTAPCSGWRWTCTPTFKARRSGRTTTTGTTKASRSPVSSDACTTTSTGPNSAWYSTACTRHCRTLGRRRSAWPRTTGRTHLRRACYARY
jgi:PRTRC genetic system ParB family protein